MVAVRKEVVNWRLFGITRPSTKLLIVALELCVEFTPCEYLVKPRTARRVPELKVGGLGVSSLVKVAVHCTHTATPAVLSFTWVVLAFSRASGSSNSNELLISWLMSKMPTLLLSGNLDRVKVAVPGLSPGLSPLQMNTFST